MKEGAETKPKPARSPVDRTPKLRLLTAQALDGRSRARKAFDSIVLGIAKDLGGEDQLSTVQKHLVEAFAGVAVNVNALNARLLMGEKIDLIAHSQAISTMVRIASRIGVHRVPKPVQSIDEFVREHYGQGDDAASEAAE